jgi:UTP--glucose-1-phosphate uridylyltransferase
VFTPAVWRVLARGDDPFLARTVRALMDREPVFACLVEGTRYDCGSKLGFLEAQFAYARKSDELWSNLSIRIGHLLEDSPDASQPVASGPQSRDMKAAIMR